MHEPMEQFRAAIHKVGLHPPGVIEPDGKLHRFAEMASPAMMRASTSSTMTLSPPALSSTAS
jgi:hypothetical protein